MAGQVGYTLELADHVAAARAAWARSLRQRRFSVRLTAISLGVLVLGFGVGLFDGTLGSAMITGALAMGAALAWLFLVCGGTWLLIPRRVRRLFRQQTPLNDAKVVTWNDRGLHYRSAKGTSDLAWSDYHDWFENRGIFMFLINDQNYHIVPYRVLAENEIIDLRETASPHFAR